MENHENSQIKNVSDNIFGDISMKKYPDREHLLDCVRDIAFSLGYVTTIKKSIKDRLVVIGCDRGGVYRPINVPEEQRKRKTSSRLINFPFEIRGRRERDGTWMAELKNISHNHDPSDDISGHPYARRFSEQEVTKIKEMTMAGALPRQILAFLRQSNPNLKSASRTLYNTKNKIIKDSLAGRSMIEALLEEFGQGDFIYDLEYDENGYITHLFFAHPSSIALTKTYSYVFVMDCTYKTNKYNMPLLDIIGMTSFNTSFYSCFACMRKEETKDYVWALTKFRSMLGVDVLPLVIVTDRELALMNAIKDVFPETVNLLCVWHIHKNLVTHCKRYFETEDDWVTFEITWANLINSPSEASFDEAWNEFQVQYQRYAQMINYINKTWLPYKEKFVEAWTNKFLHFGNRVTSRAEGAHSALKSYLQVSSGNFRTIKDKICLAIEHQFQEIMVMLSSEKIRIPHKFRIPFFKDLMNCVSLFALEQLHKQYELAMSNSLPAICTNNFSCSMGLPCAHIMKSMRSKELQLEDIHPQWRIDSISFSHEIDDEVNGLLEKFKTKFDQLPISQKEDVHRKIYDFVNNPSPLILEPIIQARKSHISSSNKRKKSTSTHRDPSAFELVEKIRKCSICRKGGHDCRACPEKEKNTGSSSTFVLMNKIDDADTNDIIDLNSLPCSFTSVPWN